MRQSHDQAQFLPHAPRHVPDLHSQIQVELVSQITPRPPQVATAHRPEDRKRVLPVHPRRQAQIARQVADIALDRFAVAPAIQSEGPGRAGGGSQESEHDADGRGLARAVRSEKSEQRPLPDRQRHSLDSTPATIAASKIVELYQGHSRTVLVRIGTWWVRATVDSSACRDRPARALSGSEKSSPFPPREERQGKRRPFIHTHSPFLADFQTRSWAFNCNNAG